MFKTNCYDDEYSDGCRYHAEEQLKRCECRDLGRASALAKEMVRNAANQLELKGRRRRLLLRHVQRCDNPSCVRPGCAEAKGLLRHMWRCPRGVEGGCHEVEGCRSGRALLEHFYDCNGPICIAWT